MSDRTAKFTCHWQSTPRLLTKKIGSAMNTMAEAAADRAIKSTLTEREIEVLRTWLICDTKLAAARTLFISSATVNTHITRIRDKYEAAGRAANTKAALLARALQDGLITVEEL
ncbi:UNVERIFIED_CONTAM: regulatory LuxR family protein [Williamsia faeni]